MLLSKVTYNLHSDYTFLISICVPWEPNPQPFALLTQCSTTEPHRNTVFLLFLSLVSEGHCVNDINMFLLISIVDSISACHVDDLGFDSQTGRASSFAGQSWL